MNTKQLSKYTTGVSHVLLLVGCFTLGLRLKKQIGKYQNTYVEMKIERVSDGWTPHREFTETWIPNI